VEEVKRKGPNLPSDDHWGNFAHCKYRHLWRFVCCCLAPLICLFAERWLLPRQLGAVDVRISRRVFSEPSCCRYCVFLTLLFVSADGNCDFMLIKS